MARKQTFGWLDWNLISAVLIIKVLIFAFAYQSFQLISLQRINSVYQTFEIWRRWDAVHYLKLAEAGYTAVGEDRFLLVYFPLFPALTALTSIVTRDTLLAGFLVAFIASMGLALAFKQLVRLDHPERVARYSVLFLFIFPTSYFLHIPYTESLFLVFTVGCFLAARKKRWLIAGCLGCLACFTRMNGIVLLPALAFEIWEDYRENKTLDPKWLWAALPIVGFGGYLALNYLVSGNPLMFMEYQSQHWAKNLDFTFHGIKETYGAMFYDNRDQAVMRGMQELLFIAIGFVGTILTGWRLRWSYLVWMAGNWLIFVSTSFILSVPRYTLIMFPLYILMAQISIKNWPAKILFVVWSLMFLGLFSMQFSRGWWAF